MKFATAPLSWWSALALASSTWLCLVEPVQGQVTLLNGRFEATSDTQALTDILNLAKDVADMREATTLEDKKNIYAQGQK